MLKEKHKNYIDREKDNKKKETDMLSWHCTVLYIYYYSYFAFAFARFLPHHKADSLLSNVISQVGFFFFFFFP